MLHNWTIKLLILCYSIVVRDLYSFSMIHTEMCYEHLQFGAILWVKMDSGVLNSKVSKDFEN